MGDDIIQQFVDWMETVGTQLAGAGVGIMAIAAIFVGIMLGKRLLNAAGGQDVCANCGCVVEGQEDWEEGFLCLECGFELGEPEDRMRAEGMSPDEIDREMYPSAYADDEEGDDHDTHVAAYDAQVWEGALSVHQCPECGHENTDDDINSDERCTECGHPLEL